eukprot:37934_1
MSVDITYLIEDNLYDASILSRLEECVIQQVASGKYDLDTNLYILKMYQEDRKATNNKVCCMILLEALKRLPNSDFLQCTYLLSSDPTNKDVETIIELARLLENAKFTQFWALTQTEECKNLIELVPDFEKSIREYIESVFGMAFRSMDKVVFMKALNMSESELQDCAKDAQHHSWILHDDGVLHFQNTESSRTQSKVDTEAVSIGQLGKVLQYLAV